MALLVGFTIDAKGFAGNLLAEIAGVLVSVLLAVFIVEKAVERERSRRWDLVAEQTASMLRFAVIRVGSHVYLRLPAPRSSASDPYTLGLLGDKQLSGALSQLAEDVRKEPELGSDKEGFVAGLRPHLEFIRAGIMPQLLAIGKHDLIALLAAVESAFQNLEHTLWLEARFGGPDQFQTDAATLVDALANVSRAIDEPTGNAVSA
jgi:hypothetical protein